MGLLKKFFHKVRKSVRRMAHGKFHLNPLKNGVHAMTDPVGHSWYRLLSKHQQHRLTKAIDFGRLKKKYRKLTGGDNSAQAVNIYAGSSYSPAGYTYSGRRIGDMI